MEYQLRNPTILSCYTVPEYSTPEYIDGCVGENENSADESSFSSMNTKHENFSYLDVPAFGTFHTAVAGDKTNGQLGYFVPLKSMGYFSPQLHNKKYR